MQTRRPRPRLFFYAHPRDRCVCYASLALPVLYECVDGAARSERDCERAVCCGLSLSYADFTTDCQAERLASSRAGPPFRHPLSKIPQNAHRWRIIVVALLSQFYFGGILSTLRTWERRKAERRGCSVGKARDEQWAW